MLVGGCKTTEKAKEIPDETVYEFHCSDSDYLQTSDFFRVHKIGESVHQSTSMKNAIQLAQQELAGVIESTLNGAIENYFHTNRILYDELLREHTNRIITLVGEESIHKVNIICEESIKTLNGLFKTYVVLEISVIEIFNELEKQTTASERLHVEVNRSEFKKFVELEMNKSIAKPIN
jgi:hypothetical protein